MALPIDPLAVKAQALLPRCSAVCGRKVFFSLWPSVLLTQNSSLFLLPTAVGVFFISEFLSGPLGTSKPMSPKDVPGLVTLEGAMQCFAEWPSLRR